jgi:hypothetical protein
VAVRVGYLREKAIDELPPLQQIGKDLVRLALKGR